MQIEIHRECKDVAKNVTTPKMWYIQ